MNQSGIDTCSVTELRRSASACIARAKESGRPLFITRRGEAVAVLMTLEQYEFMRGEGAGLSKFLAAATGPASALVDADERTARVAALRGVFKGAQVDEDDYRRYLEEKYR